MFNDAGRRKGNAKQRAARKGWPTGTANLILAGERWEVALGTRRFDEPGMNILPRASAPRGRTPVDSAANDEAIGRVISRDATPSVPGAA